MKMSYFTWKFDKYVTTDFNLCVWDLRLNDQEDDIF